MATLVSALRAQLGREINPPGFEQYPDITNTQLDGYIKDGFWEIKLFGMLGVFTQTDGTELATPPGDIIKLTADDGDFPEQFQQLVVIGSALKLIRMKLLTLAVNFKAEGGPISYDQQASATTLRAVLATLEQRLQSLKQIYSDEIGGGVFLYYDSTLQRNQSVLNQSLQLQVL